MYSQEETLHNYPKGCYVYDNNNYVYLNHHHTGQARANSRLICKRDSIAPPQAPPQAPPSVSSAYKLVPSNANCEQGYAEIRDETACRTAATKLSPSVPNISFKRTEDTSSYPRGCYFYEHNNGVYFNSHPTGQAHAKGRFICKQESVIPPSAYQPLNVSIQSITYTLNSAESAIPTNEFELGWLYNPPSGKDLIIRILFSQPIEATHYSMTADPTDWSSAPLTWQFRFSKDGINWSDWVSQPNPQYWEIQPSIRHFEFNAHLNTVNMKGIEFRSMESLRSGKSNSLYLKQIQFFYNPGIQSSVPVYKLPSNVPCGPNVKVSQSMCQKIADRLGKTYTKKIGNQGGCYHLPSDQIEYATKPPNSQEYCSVPYFQMSQVNTTCDLSENQENLDESACKNSVEWNGAFVRPEKPDNAIGYRFETEKADDYPSHCYHYTANEYIYYNRATSGHASGSGKPRCKSTASVTV